MDKATQKIGRRGIAVDGQQYWHYELLVYLGYPVTITLDGKLIQVFHNGKIIHAGQLH